MPDYVFATATATPDVEVTTSVMMRSLAAMLDEFSTKRVKGEGMREDARCLVLGVGASQIASRLADLAPKGVVFATDIDHAHAVRDERVRLLTHYLGGQPLPAGPWDVIHARLLLNHLPDRDTHLAELAEALNTGGILVVEEFTGTWNTSVLAAPALTSPHTNQDAGELGWAEANRLYSAYHHAFQGALIAAGLDLSWSRRVHTNMLNLGLRVDTVPHCQTWPGNSPGTRLPWASAELLRDKLVAHGMTAADIDAFRTLLTNPELRVLGNTVLSTIGRRIC